jgi:effector-binding domain-containing protein
MAARAAIATAKRETPCPTIGTSWWGPQAAAPITRKPFRNDECSGPGSGGDGVEGADLEEGDRQVQDDVPQHAAAVTDMRVLREAGGRLTTGASRPGWKSQPPADCAAVAMTSATTPALNVSWLSKPYPSVPTSMYRPVREPRATSRIEVIELPPADLAVAVHSGAHDDIDVTYGRLGSWVVEHALAVNGPVDETYVVAPRDTPTPADWRTEIGWPVFRLTPQS